MDPITWTSKGKDDQQEPIYNSSLPIQDVTLKTSLEQWMIETGGEIGSGTSMLAAQHDDEMGYDLTSSLKAACCTFWWVILKLVNYFSWGSPCGVMAKVLNSDLKVSLNFSFGPIPLGKVWTPLSSQLWGKYYHCYSFIRLGLEFDNPQMVICN